MIIGHQTQWQFLKRLAEGNKIPQALLFTGEDSLGKRKVALEFVKLLNIQTHVASNPDLIIIEPQTKEIQISQIRDLQRALNFRPYLAPQKSVIIDKAETLRSESQNCLLKTLEEPKGKTLFLLITSHPEMLFETIRSRCEILKFYPLAPKEMEKHFSDKNILLFSEGRPGRAIDFLKNPQKLSDTLKMFKEIQKILDSDFPQRFSFTKTFFEKGNFPVSLNTFLEGLLRYLRMLFLKKLQVENEFFNLLSISPKTPGAYSFSVIKEMINSIENLKLLLTRTNINQRLALENLMLNL